MHFDLAGSTGYACVVAVGGFVGAVELIGRYRDDPVLLVRTLAGLFYVLVNMVASAAALGTVRTMDWRFGVDTPAAINLVQTLVAGLGGLALFRANVANAAQPGGAEILRWSPGRLLDRLLRLVDGQVDRAQARKRVRITRKVMAGLSFERASVALPTFALGLLENADKDQQSKLRADVDALIKVPDLSERVKLQLLGVAVMRFTGPNLLRLAVDGLGDDISRS